MKLSYPSTFAAVLFTVSAIVAVATCAGCSGPTFVAPKSAAVVQKQTRAFWVSPSFDEEAKANIRRAAGDWARVVSVHVDLRETSERDAAAYTFEPGSESVLYTDHGPTWACGYSEDHNTSRMFVNVKTARTGAVCRGGVHQAALHEMGHAFGLGHDELASLMVDGSGARQRDYVDVFTRNALASKWGVPKESIGFVPNWTDDE